MHGSRTHPRPGSWPSNRFEDGEAHRDPFTSRALAVYRGPFLGASAAQRLGFETVKYWILPAIIAVLALADGVLHLSLDFILFRGNLFGSLGPPPGAPPPGANPPPSLPLPLNQLFVLNFLGYVALALLMWFGRERLGSWYWLVDVALLVMVALTMGGWFQMRRPNPMNLGYLSKSVEVLLAITVLVHLWSFIGQRRLSSPPRDVDVLRARPVEPLAGARAATGSGRWRGRRLPCRGQLRVRTRPGHGAGNWLADARSLRGGASDVRGSLCIG